jgi:hypothetical protein
MQASRRLLPDAQRAQQFLRDREVGGGFTGKSGKGGPDLYYTVFGLECQIALGREPAWEELVNYLSSFGQGENLDFIHQTCLLRCWANVPKSCVAAIPAARLPGVSSERMLQGSALACLEANRSADGGYSVLKGGGGSIYACFLAMGAHMDRDVLIPAPDQMAACMDSLRTGDGAYANEAALPIGTLPATAAAVAIQLYLGRQVDPRLLGWMLSCEAREGGLAAFPHWRADLLSTATGLFAISQLPGGAQAMAPIRQRCTEFVLGLWNKIGSFRSDSGMSEAYLDCEYLWYALLALGCLAACTNTSD